MDLHNLPKLKGKSKKAKRVGRGYGSGRGGHTSGRGMKGQNARNSVRLGFEGGQNPWYMRLPKAAGFKPLGKKDAIVVNIRDLERKFADGDEVTLKSLVEVGMISKNDKYIKILGEGDLTKKLTVVGIKTSKSAKKKIEKVGGEVK